MRQTEKKKKPRKWSTSWCWTLLTAAAGAGEVGIRQHDVCQQHAALEQLRGDLAAVNGSLRLLAPFGAEIAGVDLVALHARGT